MLRKPTIFMLVVAVGLAALCWWSYRDLRDACPILNISHMPVFSPNPGEEELDDGITIEKCTDQDPSYLDFKQYTGYFYESLILIAVLFVFDMIAFSTRGGTRRGRSRRRHDRSRKKKRRILDKVSEFLGGL